MTPATLTIEDIRTTDTQTGFKNVQKVGGQPSRGNSPVYFQAYKIIGPSKKRWVGPGRKTSEEAAADYCDFVNSNQLAPSTALKTAGHPRAAKRKLTPEQQVALDILRDSRAANDAPGTVYLTIETGDWSSAKIGWTGKTPPEARLGDYQAGNKRRLVMVGKFPGTKDDEKALHRRHIGLNELGEWFRLTDAVLSEFDIERTATP